MRVGVLIKQVPAVEALALGPDGRLIREGLALEINAYCRRAISQGVELARETGGTCTVFTLGPPSAEDALREAVAWGADEGVLVTDAAFAGSDTLATARALAAAVELLGPFDLILAGRNSVDADTGQVGPEVAELLGLPFLAGVKTLAIKSGTAVARLELDDGWADAEVDLPALLSCAERLCPPAKVDPAGRAAVDPGRLRRLDAGDLGPGPWGQAASPTRVGGVRTLEVVRRRMVLTGTAPEQAAELAAWLRRSGALDRRLDGPGAHRDGIVEDCWIRGEKVVAVLLEAGRPVEARQLLGAAAHLAHAVNGRVIALAAAGTVDEAIAGSWGADELIVFQGVASGHARAAGVGEAAVGGGPEEDQGRVGGGPPGGDGPPEDRAGAAGGAEARGLTDGDRAGAVGEWAEGCRPWAVLASGTLFGREVASRVAARLGAGLTGDAIELTVDGDRLLSWKPAFGGQLVAAITSLSPIQLVTVRPGMLPTPQPRAGRAVPTVAQAVRPGGRVRILAAGRDDDLDELAAAEVVVGVGAGVDPAEYPQLAPLLQILGAQLAATRKVTDQGWQPRSRQVGLTGRSLTPRLYLAIGLSGKFNHLVGVRGAGQIVAINHDPEAPVFAHADIGIVADWRQVVPLLATAIAHEARS